MFAEYIFSILMALVELPCLIGGDCDFKTFPLEFNQAKELLDGHMRYAHPIPNPTSLSSVGPTQRRNKQLEREGKPGSDGWRRFEITKDGEVKLTFSRKEKKFRCEETECRVGI